MRTDHVATIARCVLGLGVLIMCVGFGALVVAGDPERPTCGGSEMSPGDTCVRHPSGSSSTYEELRRAHTGQKQAAPGIITVGAIIAVGGVATLIVRSVTAAGPSVAARAEADWWTDSESGK
jgi:hypothetical protein